ncbi:PH domain-containing protein [Pseudomarimonas salicorniae]|uniref:PH domain-containing protein n=1 Tax=Pseudomarimonas salicorniae TaxID=2933270 RepID=A0ABT0GHX9_9GAMM|nr:PH domain-containing protein [Lysobacter sp. CAU 1642]MCK7594156.1 PH domain-containing protein [Lysobacter sp. CAU 1642]
MSIQRLERTREHPVPAPPKRAWVTLLVLGMLLPLGAILLTVALGVTGGAAAFSAAAAVSTAITLTLLGLMRRRSIRLEAGQLRVVAAFYHLRVPIADLDLERSRAVDLAEHSELRPMLKTNGFALPGYSAGHFRLRNRSKAFCLVTDPARVLALPRHDGGILLLSPERPQALREALQAAHAG